jgi:chromosome segregation ATPase
MEFLTNKAAKEKISGLEARIAELESDAEARDAELTQAQGQVAAHAQTIAEHEATITTLTAERDSALTAKATAEAETKKANDKLATFDDEVEKAVIAKQASLGVPPVVATQEGDKGNTLPYAEFSKLDHAARNAHIRNGGKVEG